jgi:hypothetical protein
VLLDDRDGDIEGQARDRDARLRGEIPLSLARARLDAATIKADAACTARVVARAPRESLCVPPDLRSEI